MPFPYPFKGLGYTFADCPAFRDAFANLGSDGNLRAPTEVRHQSCDGNGDLIVEVAKEELAGKQATLQKIRDNIAELNNNYQASARQLEELSKQKETIEVQLERAEKLVVGLKDESVRWEAAVKQLDIDLTNLIGNTLLAAGCVSYIGPFTAKYRNELIEEWV